MVFHFIRFSKQNYIQDVPQPYDLKDGAPSFKDFTNSRNNRFMNPESAAKNRILSSKFNKNLC